MTPPEGDNFSCLIEGIGERLLMRGGGGGTVVDLVRGRDRDGLAPIMCRSVAGIRAYGEEEVLRGE